MVTPCGPLTLNLPPFGYRAIAGGAGSFFSDCPMSAIRSTACVHDNKTRPRSDVPSAPAPKRYHTKRFIPDISPDSTMGEALESSNSKRSPRRQQKYSEKQRCWIAVYIRVKGTTPHGKYDSTCQIANNPHHWLKLLRKSPGGSPIIPQSSILHI